MQADFVNWHLPPPNVALGHRQVHIWRAFLDVPEEQVARFRQNLAADEIERAERFVFDRDRRDYVVGRGILRMLLARYVKRDAAEIMLAYTRHGKPYLAGDEKDHGLFFNVSHSNGVALYSITQCGQIGIDVEFERPLDDMPVLTKSIFSDKEAFEFWSNPPAQRTTMFYRYWTCKESFIKAIGQGLSFPVRELEFSQASGRLALSGDHPVADSEWYIDEFVPWPDYAGALTVDAKEVELCFWQVGFSHSDRV